MAGTVQQEMKMESQVLRDYVNRHLDSTTFVAATICDAVVDGSISKLEEILRANRSRKFPYPKEKPPQQN